ncbi:MAG: hypothetical protein WC718_11480 [Phycisphaerales bacterium]|jgi:GAF domain-containing protein
MSAGEVKPRRATTISGISPTGKRDYSEVMALAAAAPSMPPRSREQNMMHAITLLWRAFGDTALSWIGFYEKVAGADEMVLVCREPKPACSPIGLFGMCGRGWKEQRNFIVSDVKKLGADYIACDPRDQSELVIPVMNEDGSCWGVLDADSYDLDTFDEHDARCMARLMEELKISSRVPDEFVCI